MSTLDPTDPRSVPYPWRHGTHDEVRLALGGRQQVVGCDSCPPDQTSAPRGYQPAPGGAGCWRFSAAVPITDCTGDTPVTYITKVWMRWIVPVSGGDAP